jgi:hypothetical protein
MQILLSFLIGYFVGAKAGADQFDEERRIVEQTAHCLQLRGHPQAHLGEECFPQGGLRV